MKRVIRFLVLLALLLLPFAFAQTSILPGVMPESEPPTPQVSTEELQLPTALAQTSIHQGVVPESDSPTPQVSTEELKEIIAERSALILDSRSFPEWAVGHIPGAVVLAPKPGQSASQYVSDIAEVERLTGGDKDAAIILYCNGPYCGKSKRLSGELAAAGYTNVRRYQLGAPVWRALGNPMVIEPAGIQYVLNDPTAYWVDARDAAEIVVMGGLERVRNLAHVTAGTVNAAKDERRVPMHDYNARIVVFGAHGEQARQVAEELAQGAFHNVAYFGGSFEAFQAAVEGAPSHAAIGERFVAIFNEQDASIADEIFAPDFVAHVTGSPTPTLDREGWKAYLTAFRASFPDLRLEVRDVVTTEDMVILRVVLHGTQTGAFQDLPPSGKSVAFDGVAIHRIEDSQVVEHWGVMDLLSLMQQLTAGAEPTANPRSMAVETVEASTEEANKAFIRRYLEAISGQPKTEAMLREFIANEVLIEHVRVFEAAFPRYELEGEDVMAEGDKVVIRALLRGVHGGEFFGIPATGNRVEAPGIIIYRIEDGKIADFWMQADVVGLMQQLSIEPEATR